MRVAGLPECLGDPQGSAVRRGRSSLDRHSTRALTRGVPTVGGMAHATEHRGALERPVGDSWKGLPGTLSVHTAPPNAQQDTLPFWA
jgi:hypothetical protein